MTKQDYTIQLSTSGSPTEQIAIPGYHKFGGSIEVVSVQAEEETTSTAEWNVELDGNDIFSTEQSVASADTPEEFVPDQNRDAAGSTPTLVLDVSTAGGGNQLTLTVTTELNEQ